MGRQKHIILKVILFAYILLSCLLCVGCSDDTLSGLTTIFSSTEKSVANDSVKEGELEVHFIDVGQGDATLIKEGNHAMLIDAGENNQGEVVTEYLKSQKITELEYVIGTHPDSDHVGGLDVVIDNYSCKTVIMPEITSDTRTYEDVIKAVKKNNLSVTDPEPGYTYSLGEADFTIVAPNRDYGDDTNNWSVGILLTFGKNRFLFTGDAEAVAEKDMMANGIDLSADVYKAAHHGSKTGSSEVFLDVVNPKYSVISCGEDNEYGHPSAQTLNEFRKRGIQVFRTDEQGTIVALSDGLSISFNMSPDESWKAGEPKGASKNNTSGVRYVINTNTGKFHRPSCKHVDEMKSENRKNTSETKSQLEKRGYIPCGVCKP